MTTATSLAGTNAKCRNVRFCAAIGVIAGVTQTSFEDRFWTPSGHCEFVISPIFMVAQNVE